MRKSIRRETPPEGFRYQANLLPLEEEQELVEHICGLPLKEFEFHGCVGKRRTISYGWHYDFDEEARGQSGSTAFPPWARSAIRSPFAVSGKGAEELCPSVR